MNLQQNYILLQQDELIGQPIRLLIPERLREQYQQYIGKTPLNNHQNTHPHPIAWILSPSGRTVRKFRLISTWTVLKSMTKTISSVLFRKSVAEKKWRTRFGKAKPAIADCLNDLTGNFIMDGQGNAMYNPAFAKLFGFENPRVAQYSDFMERFTDDEARTDFIENTSSKKLAFTKSPSAKPMANWFMCWQISSEILTMPGNWPEWKAICWISAAAGNWSTVSASPKMESLGILAGASRMISAIFVSVIEGYAEIILMKMDETDPMRNFVEKIQQTNKQAGLLIKQIQAFSRRQEALLMRIDPNYAIRKLKKYSIGWLGKINFQLHCGVDIGTIIADPVQLEQTIMNLAVNARDAMPNGGTLTVRTYRTKLGESDVLHSEAEPGEFVCIEIQDTGIGMDEETKSRILNLFHHKTAR